MKANEIKALEGYITTKNEYWNGYAFKLLCEALQQGQFDNLETPLRLFQYADTEFEQYYKQPIKAVQMFTAEMDKDKLNPNQRLFVYEWVIKYLKNSVFGKEGEEEIKLTDIQDLLTSQMKRLKAESQPTKPLTKNIRQTLKEIVQKEFEALPETLHRIEPLQRLNIVCKLAPYVLPKVESVSHEQGEPSETKVMDFNW